ncbi:DUSAM domain-containing protein [Corallococcus macrosporus]|uniref:DUSAM domain-containing protein n=1 Tax=Corallococcus macrosporus TaxID=35 RepID=UPI0009E3E2D7
MIDWGPIRALARRVLTEGERLALARNDKALLMRTAAEVGISSSEAESALATEEGTMGLLQKESRHIREGSTRRLMDALHRMYQHKDKGDFGSARQEMRDVLEVAVASHSCAIAKGALDARADKPLRRAAGAPSSEGAERPRLRLASPSRRDAPPPCRRRHAPPSPSSPPR